MKIRNLNNTMLQKYTDKCDRQDRTAQAGTTGARGNCGQGAKRYCYTAAHRRRTCHRIDFVYTLLSLGQEKQAVHAPAGGL
jgi:hypothetical protein